MVYFKTMKFIVGVLSLVFCSGAFAQVEPFRVDVKPDGRLPEIFALAESHFTFNSESNVGDAKITSGGSQWSIEKFSEGIFVVKCKVYGRTQSVDIDSAITVALFLENGDSVQMKAPIRVYAGVKILPYGSAEIDPNSSELPCVEKIGFLARWDYPTYVKKRWRIYGVFDMEVLKGDERIQGFTGWYDSGDRTKLQSLLHFVSIGELTVRVRNIKTLHRYSQNGKGVPILFAEDCIKEWTLNCPEIE